MKKLSCHCGAVEAEVNVPEKFEKVMRCNCSICKRKGYVMSPVGENDMKISFRVNVLQVVAVNTTNECLLIFFLYI